MKTDQLMAVSIGDQVISAYHKTGEVLLADVFRAGNAYRILNGMGPMNQTQIITTDKAKAFIEAYKEEFGVDEVIRKEGRGKNSKTFIPLHLAIFVAEQMSPKFHLHVIDTFVNHKLLTWGDESGDEFIAMNTIIDQKLEDRVGRTNTGVYIDIAKAIRSIVKPDGDSWNTATALQLRHRTEIEKDIIRAINWGMIKTYPELKQFIAGKLSLEG